MVRLAKRFVVLGGVVLSLGATLPACTADVQSMMFVRQVQALVAPQCVVDNSPDSIAISSGTLDIAFRKEYTANLLVGNQLVGRGAPELSRSETSSIQMKSAIVRVENSAGQQLSAYTISVTGFVETSRAGSPSFGIVSVPLIDAAAAEAAGTEKGPRRLFSRVKVIGETLGGSEVESAEFGFPVTVCNGCLVAFPANSDDPVTTQVDCDGTGDNVEASQCILGQDAAIDCRQCRGNDACKP